MEYTEFYLAEAIEDQAGQIGVYGYRVMSILLTVIHLSSEMSYMIATVFAVSIVIGSTLVVVSTSAFPLQSCALKTAFHLLRIAKKACCGEDGSAS